MNDIYISDNFKLSEFESPDTQEVKINEELVDKLQKLRDMINEMNNSKGELGLTINSGYRTWEHHVSIYKDIYDDGWEDEITDDSQHLKGNAVDVSLDNLPYDADYIEDLAEDIGFKGIGKYNTFIHLDVRTNGQARWDNRA